MEEPSELCIQTSGSAALVDDEAQLKAAEGVKINSLVARLQKFELVKVGMIPSLVS